MKLIYSVPLALHFLCFLITITATSVNPTHFTGDVSIDCGSSRSSKASDGREWIGDVQPKLLQLKGSSTISTATSYRPISAGNPVPHKTARISRSRFSVEAGPFTLLSNFSASALGAWALWNEGEELDLVDESLGGVFPVEEEEALRCIQVGLLCTQDYPHRPAMDSVLKMLEGGEPLPEPQQPHSGFQIADSIGSSSHTDELHSTFAMYQFNP